MPKKRLKFSKTMSNDFLSNSEMDQLVDAIRIAESASTGEIRIHIDHHSTADFAKEALDLFHGLEMQNTKERNGVLFYVNFEHRYLTIIGDEGIHLKVSQTFWDEMHDQITQSFSHKKYFAGLQKAVLETGIELKKHFPTNGENKNELPNEISFS